MFSVNNTNYQINFRAKLIMPEKATNLQRGANAFCAEQVELARPIIEKIAKGATRIEKIYVVPRRETELAIKAVTNWGESASIMADQKLTDQQIIKYVKLIIEKAENGDL